jgi:hypothetical protein
MYVDVTTDTWYNPQVRLSTGDPNYPVDMGLCGKTTFALTSVSQNWITFCPLAWGNWNEYDLGSALPTMTAGIAVTQNATYIDQLLSLSMTLLHEYTHLVARGTYLIQYLQMACANFST